MKLAIVSPLPPVPTGIADYSVDVARSLGGAHAVEFFHDQAQVSPSLPAPAFSIRELEPRSRAAPYDAVIYQMGNAPAHDFMYEWMPRIPGIVVLHDLVLHAYTRRFLESPESMAYATDPSNREKQARAAAVHHQYLVSVEAVYPGSGERLKDAHFNSVGDLLPYAFPLFEPALAHARAAAAHNSFMVDAMRAARPDLACAQVVMPVQPLAVDESSMARLRSRLGLGSEDVVVGCFGLLTREKRIETVARAVARIAAFHPRVRLLLAGPIADSGWLDSTLERSGMRPRAIVTGHLESEDFIAAMAVTDLVAHLRYPTARETSAALLRVMAQGRPVIISDIANQSEIPLDAAKRVDLCDEEGDLARAIDALLRRPEEARAMGVRACAYVRAEHSDTKARQSYEQLLKSIAPDYSPRHP